MIKKVKIGIIETNFGNIASVVNAVSYLKYNFNVKNFYPTRLCIVYI